MLQLSEKRCEECAVVIVGRSDKKFCCDQCRNTFNNRLNSYQTKVVRNTNNLLRRNTRILRALNQSGSKIIGRTELLSKGFDFNYFTSMIKTKDGQQFFYCYDQGYLRLRKGKYQLVSWSKK